MTEHIDPVEMINMVCAGLKHRLVVNPFDDLGFTRCPDCGEKTRVRKFPLVFMVPPALFGIIDMKAKYCPDCDIIVVKESEFELRLEEHMVKRGRPSVGSRYLLGGTLERKDYRRLTSGKVREEEGAAYVMERMYVFVDAREVLPDPYEPDEYYNLANLRENPHSKTRPLGPTTLVYEIELELVGADPRIRRRFAISADETLAYLHDVIIGVMGWDDYHLHCFEIKKQRYEMRGTNAEQFQMDPEPLLYETDFTLRDLVKRGSRIDYEYDFGDGWRHKLKVVRTGSPEEGVAYPVCLGGERACPPEDCGGTWGYRELLATLADPTHEDHEDMAEWAGAIDPEAFDIDEVNRRLKAIR